MLPMRPGRERRRRVTGQNQNSGYETSHRVLEVFADKQQKSV
jgi:hypothetical protein